MPASDQTISPPHTTNPDPQRRHDLDWLRVLAFGVLVFVHAGVPFLHSGIPNIMNDVPSPVITPAIAFLHQFRLSLLFLVSGMGVCFALGHRSLGAFVKDRAVRLLVPLAFGILVVVPPAVFLEQRFNGDFVGSYAEFYSGLFTTGSYPNGRLSWHHYWFVLYLFVMCLLALPLMAWWRGPAGGAWLDRLSRQLGQGWHLYAAIAPLLLAELALRPLFPGFRDLITDWASFTHWFLVFLLGYTMARTPALLDRACALRWPSLGIAMAMSLALFAWNYDQGRGWLVVEGDTPRDKAASFIGYAVFKTSMIWTWLLALTGFAGRYLNAPSPALTWLSGAVYPVFCLHLSVTLAIAYVVLPLDWPIWAKYLTIVMGTFSVVLAAYAQVIQRIGRLGILVGARPNPRISPEKRGPEAHGNPLEKTAVAHGPSPTMPAQ